MYRNSEQHFAAVPTLHQSRSIFDLSTNHKTTLNVGDIVPLYVNTDIIPGDTFKVNESMVLRMQVPIYPTMDNIWIDTYWFFVPHRIVWEHWKEFLGENTTGAWEQTTEYTIPITKTGASKITKGDMLDYFGIQTDATNLWFISLAQRAYIKIYNDWFRNQNLIAPLTEITGDSDTTYSHGTITTGGGLCKAAKVASYLTTCLPAPQKGDPVTLPLGTSAPVYGDEKALRLQTAIWDTSSPSSTNLAKLSLLGSQANDSADRLTLFNKTGGVSQPVGYSSNTSIIQSGDASRNYTNVVSKEYIEKFNSTTLNDIGSGLYADLSTATASTINALRLAFQTQKILERDARGGTRMAEILLVHYGVKNPLFNVLQMPEYLGGGRQPINIIQTTQTTGTANSPLGQPGATSITGATKRAFTKSFTEHGTLMCVGVIRYSHSYQQKIHKMWRRQRRLDIYWPELQHIGEQPVYNFEIYAQGDSVKDANGKIIDNQVFGYQERYGELRYGDDLVTGELRSTYSTPLDTWHYADNYNSLPVLNQSWIEENPNFVKRTLAVQNQDMFLGDFYFDITAYRPIGMYGTPELLDHF